LGAFSVTFSAQAENENAATIRRTMAASKPKKGSRVEKAFWPRLRCAIETIAGGGSGVMAQILPHVTENSPARREPNAVSVAPLDRSRTSFGMPNDPPSIRQSKGQNNGFSMMIDALPQPAEAR
jgi:hypothetical protein